ncbi:MAG: rod shape-determining protein MreC [Clostridiales bacterium]|nr:rod shape-determining protein MreC [Clostridiales bacterium]
MKDFFHKNGVLLLVIALLLSLLVGISSALMGGTADPLSNAATTITAPVRSLVSNVLDWAEGVYNYVFRYEELNTELDTLRKQVADLEAQLRESGEAARENQQLRQLLRLQEKHQDFVFESARVTQRSTTNWESTFTLSKGSSAGVQTGNCVISETGALVGVVKEVGLNYCRVSTVINTDIEMGGICVRTDCAGILEGGFALMSQGRLKLSYLPDDAQLRPGDQILTSGQGDIYPPDLVVGRVEELRSDPSGMMRYAVLKPQARLDSLVEVFIIKEFDVVE